ncbi:MAG TPA: TonB-dependent receptor [Edaphobacter sp.]|nr:TonB-dependent receptor [Edaphobacter sp.]
MKKQARRKHLQRRFVASRNWLAMGTLAATVMGAGRQATAAVTAGGGAVGASAAPSAGLPVKRVNIPAGALDAAIAAYELQTGVHVRVNLPQGTLEGFQTKGVSGLFAEDEALELLLAGTGLSFRLAGDAKAVVGLRANDSVDVSTSANSVALSQFTEPLSDVPQTVNVVPQFVMQEQAVTTMRDTLRNVPGISIAAGEGGAQGDNLTIRGFSARNDIFLDGIRDFGSYYRDSFNYDAVEVLQGPASVEFGRGSTGGVVNQEQKQPMMQEAISGSLQLGTNLMRRVTADINEPLPALGSGTALRLNVAGTQSNVAERDITEVRRFGIAPSIAFKQNSPTRFLVSYLHESEDSTPDYGLPYFLYKLPKVDHTNYYGFANDNYLRTNPDVVTGRVEHDFSAPVSVRSTLRWANYPRHVRITEPQVPNTPVFSATGGVSMVTCVPPACFPINYDPNLVQVRRNQIAAKGAEDMLWDQTSVVARLKLAHVENNVVVMLEGGRERSHPLRTSYTVPNTSLLHPNPYDLFDPSSGSIRSNTHVSSTSYGLNLLDTLKLTPWLQLSGGIRFDYFNTDALTDAVGSTPATHVNRLDKQPTYRAAVVIKPRHNGSVYFDYGTSFNPSAESLSLSGNNAALPPELNSTTEIGTKWDFMNDRLNLSGSYFATEKQNARETDPTNTANTILVGTQLVRGVQVAAIGHMPAHFDVIAGYAFLNGRVEKSILNASPWSSLYVAGDPVYGQFPYFISPKGFPFANVPKNSGNLWVTHDLWWHFTGGFGGNYVSARRASSAAMVAAYDSATPVPVTDVPLTFKSIPGYWTFNAMLRRPISDHLEFQANVINLTNKFYIDQPHPNHLVPGEGVNAQMGFNVKF